MTFSRRKEEEEEREKRSEGGVGLGGRGRSERGNVRYNGMQIGRMKVENEGEVRL